MRAASAPERGRAERLAEWGLLAGEVLLPAVGGAVHREQLDGRVDPRRLRPAVAPFDQRLELLAEGSLEARSETRITEPMNGSRSASGMIAVAAGESFADAAAAAARLRRSETIG